LDYSAGSPEGGALLLQKSPLDRCWWCFAAAAARRMADPVLYCNGGETHTGIYITITMYYSTYRLGLLFVLKDDGAPASRRNWHVGRYCSSLPVENDSSNQPVLQLRANLTLAVAPLGLGFSVEVPAMPLLDFDEAPKSRRLCVGGW